MRLCRTRWLLAAAGLMTAAATSAQTPAERDARYRQFLGFAGMVSGGTIQPRWLADGSSFWYSEGGPDSTVILRVDPARNTVEPLLDVTRTRRAIAGLLGHEPPYRGLPFTSLTFEPGERSVRFTVESRELVLDLADYAVRQVSGASAAERRRAEPQVIRPGSYGGDPDVRELPSPDGRRLVGDRDGDLWIRSTADGRTERLTTGGSPEQPWSVAINSEWSNTSHTAKWSPDGLTLAAMRADYRGMARLPVVHWLKPVEEVEWRPYVKAGGLMPRTELALIDVLSRRTVPVDSASVTDHYVIPIEWRPDGSELLYFRMRRDYKVLEVFAAERTTGRSRLLIRETQPTFIKGISSNPGWNELFTLLPDGRRFVWQSERDGWDHLYLHDISGAPIRRLTSGPFPVIRVVGSDDRAVYFTGHAEPRKYDTHLYRVGLDGRGFARLTDGAGEHAAVLSPSGKYLVDTHSSLDRPPTTELRSTEGRLVRVLSTASIDRLTALGFRPAEEAWVPAADGRTAIRAVVTVPVDFDPARKYPVVENIYAGPQLVYGPRSFGSQGFNQALAQLGFVIVTIDGRGTIERGKAFQDVVSGKFGQQEIPDHVAALRALASTRPWMDLTRVGIFGGSWGGYMTVRALLTAPEFYHVGVSIYPAVDLWDHWNLIEGYMDLPVNNPTGYAAGSSLRLADRLRGKLMLMHGTSDVNATFSASMKMVDALTRAGKPYDLVVFPGESHAMTAPAVAYRTERMVEYLRRHLAP